MLTEHTIFFQIAPELEAFQQSRLSEGAKPIKLPIPKCYMAKYVPSDNPDSPPATPTQIDESVIILEDLKHEGYQDVDFIKGLTLEQAESALEAISRLHGLSLAMKVFLLSAVDERQD